jgi:biotin carboxyl carrier protein
VGDDATVRVTVEGPEPLALELAEVDPVALDGPPIEVRSIPPSREDRLAGRTRHEVTVDGWVLRVTCEPAARARLRERAGLAGARGHATGYAVVKAQIPGRVVRVWVAAGDTVEHGQRLLAVEAMKMENEVRSPRAGTVVAVAVAVGSSVELGDELVRVE